MVSTRNTSRSNANPLRMQDPPSDADNRPPDTLEAMQANTNEVEALRLVNQHLIGELEQLIGHIQRPRDTRQAQEGHNFPPHEGQHNLDIPRGAETEAESSRARGTRTPTSSRRGRQRSSARRMYRERRTASPSARSKRAIMGAEVQEPSTRSQPCEGSG